MTERAAAEGITKGMLLRRYVREGLRPSTGEPQPEVIPARGKPFIRRAYELEDDLCGKLASRASFEGVSQNEMFRRFIDEGLARPPKPQAVTRLYELSFLKESHAVLLREAEEVIKRALEPVERIKKEIAEQMEALRACCTPEEFQRIETEFRAFIDDR